MEIQLKNNGGRTNFELAMNRIIVRVSSNQDFLATYAIPGQCHYLQLIYDELYIDKNGKYSGLISPPLVKEIDREEFEHYYSRGIHTDSMVAVVIKIIMYGNLYGNANEITGTFIKYLKS